MRALLQLVHLHLLRYTRGKSSAFDSMVTVQMCKRKLGTHIRGKKKREELAGVLRKMQAAAKSHE